MARLKTFYIPITEKRTKRFKVMAENDLKARLIAEAKYHKGEIKLTEKDIVSVGTSIWA